MSANNQLIRGLDTIRFICAFWVVMGHFGPPPLTGIVGKSTALGWAINGAYNNLVSGPAAVIVFFVISGFCIHFPHAKTFHIPSTTSYFLRRYIRICIPMLAAVLLAKYTLNFRLDLFERTILWSLLAELIYYSIYPLLLALRRSGISWTKMIAISFGAALAVACTDPSAGDYPSFGPWLNWVLGLPCWLMGCKLAEHVSSGDAPATEYNIWIWRFAILILSTICSIARFHSPLGYPWTLNIFAVAAAFWLQREIYHFQQREPSRQLEWAGTWSYSLYLSHGLAMVTYKQLMVPNLSLIVGWILQMIFILAGAYVFARAIEFPAHGLARRVSRRFNRYTPPASTR